MASYAEVPYSGVLKPSFFKRRREVLTFFSDLTWVSSQHYISNFINATGIFAFFLYVHHLQQEPQNIDF